MSADNWARCPRCTFRENARLEARAADLKTLYGTVSVEEFDKARAALAADRTTFEKRDANFREDYEIYGAETGTVTVSYGGSCMDCGLTLNFDHEHRIPDWDKP